MQAAKKERQVDRVKTSDLDRLPDKPWLRYEIVDGELIVANDLYQSTDLIQTALIPNLTVRVADLW